MSDTKDFRVVTSNNGSARSPIDFNKMRIDNRLFKDDVSLNTSTFNKKYHKRIRKHDVYRALERQDLKELRAISNYFFLKSGIYSRLCRYMAYLYRYD